MNPNVNYKKFLKDNIDYLSLENGCVVAAFYKFFQIDDILEFQKILKLILKDSGINGTILVAHEGINGTITGKVFDVSKILNQFWLIKDLVDLEPKYSLTNKMPFLRMKIKLRKEIVSLGVKNILPNKMVGHYVKPEDWNQLIEDKNVLLIDARNKYEVSIGSFENAINPNINNFREFPEWVSNNLIDDKAKTKNKKIAMFCTGGIRCEKSTSYLKSLGFNEVYHLDGGILKYLEKTSEDKSKWNGSCFVFDYRVSVKHDLKVGDYDMCYACRMPVSDADKNSEYFIQGQSCHHCYNSASLKQKVRFKERLKQIQLSKKRNERHIGNINKKNLN